MADVGGRVRKLAHSLPPCDFGSTTAIQAVADFLRTELAEAESKAWLVLLSYAETAVNVIAPFGVIADELDGDIPDGTPVCIFVEGVIGEFEHVTVGDFRRLRAFRDALSAAEKTEPKQQEDG